MLARRITTMVFIPSLVFSAVGYAQERDKLKVSTLFIGSSLLPI